MTSLAIEIPAVSAVGAPLGSPVLSSLHCATPTPRCAMSPASPAGPQTPMSPLPHAHMSAALRQWLLEWNLRHHGVIKENLPPQQDGPPDTCPPSRPPLRPRQMNKGQRAFAPEARSTMRGGLLERF
jgi:hypothetical protein